MVHQAHFLGADALVKGCKHDMKEIIFTRKELYDLVWSESMLSLSKKYNISDVGLRKICIRMNIPIPANGHWSKVKWKHKVIKPKLTNKYSGEPTVKLVMRSELVKPDNPLKQLKYEISQDEDLPLIVPDILRNPDPMVTKARESLSKHNFQYNGILVSTGYDELSITVSPALINRALRFMNSLIKLVRARGHIIKVVQNETLVIINRYEIRVRIREMLHMELVKREGFSWSEAKYSASGNLAFSDCGFRGKEWKDGSKKIETRLAEILAYLELKAKTELEEQIRREKYWAAQKKEAERQKAWIEKQKNELIEFKKLLGRANRFHQANIIRDYIAMAGQKEEIEGIGTMDLSKWLEWAKKKVEWYDPFIEAEDELLEEVDKDELVFKRNGF